MFVKYSLMILKILFNLIKAFLLLLCSIFTTADVIATLSKKKVFSRNFMETTMGLPTGQAYWYIQHFLRTGMIKKLKATEYVGNKGKQQALYKYTSK